MHGFTRNYLCTQMCEQCFAIKNLPAQHSPLHFKDMWPDPGYAVATMDHELYLRMERQPSPWLKVAGWRLETVTWDLLHNVFLGVARDLIASSLKALVLHGCFDVYGGVADEDKTLKRITVEMRTYCKKHGTLSNVGCFFEPSRLNTQVISCWNIPPRLPRMYLPRRSLTVSNLNSFGKDDYAELGTTFKGAHVKTMVWWLARKTQAVSDASGGNATQSTHA